MRWNSEKQGRLQAQILSPARFIDSVFDWQLKNSRHAADWLTSIQFFTDEQRQNQIVNGQIRLTDKVPQGRGTPQATRAMNQSSHRARLPARRDCRKPTVIEIA